MNTSGKLGDLTPRLGRDEGRAVEATSAANVSPRYVWYVILLLSVVNVFNYMDRMALSVLMPFIKEDMRLTDAQLGLLVGFAFSLFYAICGIPIARWADRGVRRNIISIALALWSAMTALSGAAQNFWHLFAARIGVGVGEAGCLPPAQSIICDYVPLKRRSGVFAVHNFGLMVGMMLGLSLAGWLGEVIGWRWAFLALGLPGLLLALVVRATLREPVRGLIDKVSSDDASRSIGATLSYLWRCRTYLWMAGFFSVNGFVQYGLYQWWPSFYARVYGLSLSSIGLHLGVAIGVGSGIGMLLGGVVANRAAQRDVRLPLIVGAVSTAVALPAAVGTLFVGSASASMWLVLVTAIFWSVSNGPAVATVYSVALPHMRATAGTITIFFASVLGFGLGPFCVGLLSDALAPTFGSEALRYAMVLPACLLPGMVIVLYGAARSLPNDLKAAGVAV